MSVRDRLERDLSTMQEVLAEAALLAERQPDNPEATESLIQVERELLATRRRLRMHELAQQAAQREAAERQRGANEAHVRSMIADIEKLHAGTQARAAELLDTIGKLGPLWSAVLAGLAQAQDLTIRAARLRGGAAAVQHLVNLDAHADLSAAVGAHIAESGLGTAGPSLSPWVTISAPSGAFLPVDLPAALEALQARRMAVVERAANIAGIAA
jgi:hypothetical protein